MSIKQRLAALEGELVPQNTGADGRKELWDHLVKIDERLGEVDPTEEWCRGQPVVIILAVALRYWRSRQPPEALRAYVCEKS